MNVKNIPGVVPMTGREYRYILDDGKNKFAKKGLFDKLTIYVTPLIPQSGGAITENCKLWLTGNELFHALSYKGDIEGWRNQIEKGAEHLNLLTAKVINDKIELSDGRAYNLSDCKVEFY